MISSESVPGNFSNSAKVFASFSVNLMMRIKTKNRSSGAFVHWMLFLAGVALPFSAGASWTLVASEPGKRVEIDRDSIVTNANGESMARGRIVLDKPIVDLRTSASYRIIEITNRYDCSERTYATLKRSYFREDGDVLRQEEVKLAYDMPVRSGTPDDKLFREVCRPKGTTAANASSASQTIEKVNEAAAELRQHNEAMIEKEVRKDVLRLSAKASAALSGTVSGGKATRSRSMAAVPVSWGYEGEGAPDRWGSLRPEYATCASGRRQSPIDLGNGIAVDLEPLHFAYKPSAFRVIDGGKNLLVMSDGGSFSLLGKRYALIQVLFHRPAEMTVAGKTFEMDVQLLHRADDGKLAIISVLLERGPENPVVQSVLNHLPLERGGEVAPPSQMIDMASLMPENKGYYTFMGSLTTPPCTEDVLWLVLKATQPISSEQLAIFQRLYPPNARPVQPGWGRIIKESR